MGNRDRPKKQPRRKPKDKTHKAPAPLVYEPTSVEIIQPRRKPRADPDAG